MLLLWLALVRIRDVRLAPGLRFQPFDPNPVSEAPMTIVPVERQMSPKHMWHDFFTAGMVSERQTDLVVVGDTGVDFFVSVAQMPTRDGKAIGEHLGRPSSGHRLVSTAMPHGGHRVSRGVVV